MIQALTGGACAFGIMMYFFHLRSKFQKQARNHVLCEFITQEGTSHKDLLEVVDGLVHLKGNKKKNKKGRDYPTGGNATYLTDYPEGIWVPAFLKTPVRKMIFDEMSWEPVFNRGDPLLSPANLHSIRTEKYTEMGARHSMEEAQLEKKKAGILNTTLLYMMLGGILAAVGAVGYIAFSRFQEMMEMLDKLSKALGVG